MKMWAMEWARDWSLKHCLWRRPGKKPSQTDWKEHSSTKSCQYMITYFGLFFSCCCYFFSVINPLHVERRVIKTLSIMMRMIRLDMVWMKFALPSLSANFTLWNCKFLSETCKFLYMFQSRATACVYQVLFHAYRERFVRWTVVKGFHVGKKGLNCWLRPSPLSALPSLPSGALEMPLETASSTRSISSLSTRSLNR